MQNDPRRNAPRPEPIERRKVPVPGQGVDFHHPMRGGVVGSYYRICIQPGISMKNIRDACSALMAFCLAALLCLLFLFFGAAAQQQYDIAKTSCEALAR